MPRPINPQPNQLHSSSLTSKSWTWMQQRVIDTEGHHLAAALEVKYMSLAEVKSQWTSIYKTKNARTADINWQSLLREWLIWRCSCLLITRCSHYGLSWDIGLSVWGKLTADVSACSHSEVISIFVIVTS